MFIKNIIKLLSGSAIAQLIQFAMIPFFTRVYSPASFAILAEVQSISTIFVILLTLQMHLYIPISKNNEEADEVLSVINLISITLFLFFIGIALFIKGVFFLAIYLVIFLGLSNTFNSYLVYKGNFNKLSFFSIFRSMSIVILQIIFYYLKIQDGLIYGAIIGEGLTSLGLFLIVRSYGVYIKNIIKIKRCIFFIKKLKSFSLYGTLQELLAVATFYLPIIMTSHKFSMNVAGQYATASRLVWAPIILLSGAMVQAFSHQIGASYRTEIDNIEILVKFNKKSIFMALIALVISFNSSSLFLFILGPKWHVATKIIPIIIIWSIFYLFSVKYRVLCRFFYLQQKCVLIEFVTLLFLLGVYILPHISIITFSYFVALIGVVQNLCIMILIYYFMRMKIN